MTRSSCALTACLFLAAAVVNAAVPAAALAQPPESPAGRPAAPAVVSRTVLPDGTIEIRYDDGTSRRIAADDVLAAASQGGTEMGEQEAGPGAGDATLMPVAPPDWLADPETGRAFRDALHGYYAYRLSGYEHRQRVFAWQLSSSKVIFATVLVLVFSGIAFAALQFYAGFRRPVTSGAGVAETVTELDVSATGVKVSSPVLGVIILVLSLAFFYLYLVYVYPIAEIF